LSADELLSMHFLKGDTQLNKFNIAQRRSTLVSKYHAKTKAGIYKDF